MNYQFSMYGRIVQTYHYNVKYNEMVIKVNEIGELIEEEVERVLSVPSKEEADFYERNFKANVEEIKDNTHEWMNGIEVDDVPDVYEEAMKIADMGQQKYIQKLEFDRMKNPETLRADVDYIKIVGGY